MGIGCFLLGAICGAIALIILVASQSDNRPYLKSEIGRIMRSEDDSFIETLRSKKLEAFLNQPQLSQDEKIRLLIEADFREIVLRDHNLRIVDSECSTFKRVVHFSIEPDGTWSVHLCKNRTSVSVNRVSF